MEENGKRPSPGAYATLLTANSYAIGVKVLAWSLRAVESKYPLLVLYTPDTLDSEIVEELRSMGCLLRPTSRVQLVQKSKFAVANYAECWTKLKFFELVEFDRLVYLDADMLVRRNLDELMELDIPDGWIAASHGCKCNPMKKTTYPSDWNPSICAYTHYEKIIPTSDTPTYKTSSGLDYFNAGLLVLKPSLAELETLMNALFSIPDLTAYTFAEQDFLNDIYKGRWIPLSYKYNALKTFRVCHSNMWDDEEIKIVHYILDKPWNDLTWAEKPERERKKDPFYTVNSWWFDAFKTMIKYEKLRNI